MKTSIYQKVILCAFLWFFSQNLLHAQQRVLTGTVVDVKTNTPLSGVSISAPKTIGTLTDVQGRYSLKLNAPIDSLTFSYVGYRTKIVVMDTVKSDLLNVALLAQDATLEQVVVVGYGT
ncbi:MAG TPA: carboxypeptidase-like regulatory domain-containing protein, partial [Arachidicoccus sp.]|nr:carboxypeptidase-like regulatory domain-containing protein [Arachidicoccus sp.]